MPVTSAISNPSPFLKSFPIVDPSWLKAWRAGRWKPGVYSIARFELVDQGGGAKIVFDHAGFSSRPRSEIQREIGVRALSWEQEARKQLPIFRLNARPLPSSHTVSVNARCNSPRRSGSHLRRISSRHVLKSGAGVSAILFFNSCLGWMSASLESSPLGSLRYCPIFWYMSVRPDLPT